MLRIKFHTKNSIGTRVLSLPEVKLEGAKYCHVSNIIIYYVGMYGVRSAYYSVVVRCSVDTLVYLTFSRVDCGLPRALFYSRLSCESRGYGAASWNTELMWNQFDRRLGSVQATHTLVVAVAVVKVGMVLCVVRRGIDFGLRYILWVWCILTLR